MMNIREGPRQIPIIQEHGHFASNKHTYHAM
uniref:Uncharacterized protein n=1 Tax=Rhizophora mucronata TaxID=61149 RepID=A0A2P2NUG9_RHIMU